MKLVFSVLFGILLIGQSDECSPSSRSRGLLNSYIPACIQIMHYYRTQFKRYYPYIMSKQCQFGREINFNWNQVHKRDVKNDVQMINKESDRNEFTTVAHFEEATSLLPVFYVPKGADICILFTDMKLTHMMNELHKEAKKRNMEESEGFSFLVLMELEKTSRMSAANQLYYMLDKLLQETEGLNEPLKCLIIEFMTSLKRPDSKLYRNLLAVEPLKYVIWR